MNEGSLLSVTNRRTVLKGGAGALAALAALRLGTPVLAQDATPVGSPVAGVEGLYAAVRIRTVKPEEDADALFKEGEQDFVPIVTSISGFVAWLGLFSDEARTATFFNVFKDKAGSDDATAKAKDYTNKVSHYYVDPNPQVVDGEIVVAAGADMSKDLVGKYGVFRIREFKPEEDAAAFIESVRTEFVPIVTAVTGFIGYWGLHNEETHSWTTFGIFADKAGADESTAKGTDFGNANAH